MSPQLTLRALTMAIRGSRYACRSYQKRLAQHGMLRSMSRRGSSWDNAPTESGLHTLKTGQVRHRRCQTRQEARLDFFEYVEAFYNRQRRQSFLGCPPNPGQITRQRHRLGVLAKVQPADGRDAVVLAVNAEAAQVFVLPAHQHLDDPVQIGDR